MSRFDRTLSTLRPHAELHLIAALFYDHLVRQEGEFDKIRRYIEENPVRAGLVVAAGGYRWSSDQGGSIAQHAEIEFLQPRNGDIPEHSTPPYSINDISSISAIDSEGPR
jgi:hypothetical protein